ncbi:MAG: preprotein translocase subunit SecE [Candidatus Omnitrophota bacterium]
MIRFFKRFPKFLKEAKEELKKVNWSSRQELKSAAVLVIITCSFLTGYIFLVDLSLSRLVQLILK